MSDAHNPKDDLLDRISDELAEHKSQYNAGKSTSDAKIDVLQRDVTELRVSAARLEVKAENLEKSMDAVRSSLDSTKLMIMVPLWSAVLGFIGILIKMAFFS